MGAAAVPRLRGVPVADIFSVPCGCRARVRGDLGAADIGPVSQQVCDAHACTLLDGSRRNEPERPK